MKLLWPWRRFAQDAHTMELLANNWAESVESEFALMDRVKELQQRVLDLSRAGVERATENAALKLAVSTMQAQMNIQINAAANARAENVRLQAELHSLTRSSVVIYPPTEYSAERTSELEREMHEQQNAATPPTDPGPHTDHLDDDLVYNGWPFGSGSP